MAASNSAVGRYNNAVTVVNDIRKKIDSLKANDPEVCLDTIYVIVVVYSVRSLT